MFLLLYPWLTRLAPCCFRFEKKHEPISFWSYRENSPWLATFLSTCYSDRLFLFLIFGLSCYARRSRSVLKKWNQRKRFHVRNISAPSACERPQKLRDVVVRSQKKKIDHLRLLEEPSNITFGKILIQLLIGFILFNCVWSYSLFKSVKMVLVFSHHLVSSDFRRPFQN